MGRIVVTGGAGFLGSHLCARLLDRGDQVVCLDNLITGSLSNIEHLFGRPGFTFVELDVSTYVWVPGEVDAVIARTGPYTLNRAWENWCMRAGRKMQKLD